MRAPTRSRIKALYLLLFCALAATALGADGEFDLDRLTLQARMAGQAAQDWYHKTPPAERVTWGGLAACAVLSGLTLLERSFRLRRGRILPKTFTERFLDRLHDGKLDRGKATDFCEMNPSPAARVAMAAVRRWGRAAGELERAATLARQLEADRLRRHVGTLRRVSALAPLIGLLGTLISAQNAFQTLPAGANWGPVVAGALAPLTAGVALAILALVAYDGLIGRVETLSNDLDRLGAEIVDAVLVASIESRLGETRPHAPSAGRGPHAAPARSDTAQDPRRTTTRDRDDD